MDGNQHRIATDAFRSAVSRAGSQTAFERLTGAKQQNVSNWLRKGKVLPAEHVLKVEQSTGVSRHLLRPDIYPADETASATTPYRPDPAAVRSNDDPAFDRSASHGR